MKIKYHRIISILVSLVIMLIFTFQVSALDNKYYISDIGMTVKLPKNYLVVTADSEENDENFEAMGLDYNETMTAFHAADIYLQAQDIDKTFKINITMTEDSDSKKIVNYNELTDDQLQSILDTFLEDESYTEGNVIKHGNCLCLDTHFVKESDSKKIYGFQIHTVINGMNINFTMQKDKEFTSDDEKILVNMVNGATFDKIKTQGPTFEWWRVLLWIVIMAVICFAIHFIYKQNKEINKRKKAQRKRKKRPVIDPLIPDRPDFARDAIRESERRGEILKEDEREKKSISFDEVLGYQETVEFTDRNASDLDGYDINVKNTSSTKGIEYFEDNGESILKSEDYFERYFKEQVPHRRPSEKAASAITTYIKIFFRHLKYFFQNLGRKIKKMFTHSYNND